MHRHRPLLFSFLCIPSCSFFFATRVRPSRIEAWRNTRGSEIGCRRVCAGLALWLRQQCGEMLDKLGIRSQGGDNGCRRRCTVICAMSWLDCKLRSMRRPVAVCTLIRHSNLIRDEAFSLPGGLFWLLWRRRVGEEKAVGGARRA